MISTFEIELSVYIRLQKQLKFISLNLSNSNFCFADYFIFVNIWSRVVKSLCSSL